MLRKIVLPILSIALTSAFACTTFATYKGESGNFLMAKNRDNNPDRQVIEVVATPSKYKYLALSRQDVPDFVSAGINEYNLAVFNEVTIEYSKYAVGGIADDFSKDILQNYRKAVDVIPDLPKLIAKYPDPVFYQVADGENLLSIEVAPQHKYTYTLTKRGTYVHTNNYTEKNLISNYPYTPSELSRLESSITRYNRANQLITSATNVNLGVMQKIGLDHNAGNDDSILRIGSGKNISASRSLAFFGVSINADKKSPAQVATNLYNVGEKYTFTLTPEFWAKFESGVVILAPNLK